MSAAFWDGPTYAVIKGMKAAGNQQGMVARWIATVAKWADDHQGLADAAAIRAWLPHWQARPFYTAAELAPIFPALALAFTDRSTPPPTMSGARLANELKFGKLPVLRNANGSTYFHNVMGILQEYFIVEQIHKWSKVALSQEEFELILFGVGKDG